MLQLYTWFLIHFKWWYSSFRLHQIFPILIVQMLFPPNSTGHWPTQVNRMSRSRRVLAIGGKQRFFGLDMVFIETILFHLESF